MSLGLMTRFIGLIDTVYGYTSQLTITHTLVTTVTYSLPLLGFGFQQQMLPFFWVSELPPTSAKSKK
jgi:hypothetical protein